MLQRGYYRTSEGRSISVRVVEGTLTFINLGLIMIFATVTDEIMTPEEWAEQWAERAAH
jgi:hypothetical protein